MTMPPHPGTVYSGKLNLLLDILSEEAGAVREAWPQDRQWASRSLKGGAMVGVRIDRNGRRYLRISREKTPDSEKAWKAWRAELGTFHHHLGTKDWEAYQEDQSRGIVSTFAEPVEEEDLEQEEGGEREPAAPQGVVTTRRDGEVIDTTQGPPADRLTHGESLE
jgi:hypothetical protein